MSLAEHPIRRWTEEERNAIKRRRIGRLARRWWGRKLVNLFIVWHLFALAIWLLPSSGAIVQDCLGVVRPYMTTTGFAQSWNMFSPRPDNLDVYLEAEITYANGEKRPWPFPRMVHMGYTRRYQEERWRKTVEVATHNGSPALWTALARYAARQAPGDSQNPPVSVKLIQHSRFIPPLGQPIPPYSAAPVLNGSAPLVTPIHAKDLR